jgi:hypothetical protein
MDDIPQVIQYYTPPLVVGEAGRATALPMGIGSYMNVGSTLWVKHRVEDGGHSISYTRTSIPGPSGGWHIIMQCVGLYVVQGSINRFSTYVPPAIFQRLPPLELTRRGTAKSMDRQDKRNSE